MTRSLHTIVESAIVSTITMPVAADRPPRNTTRASSCWSSAIGSASTKVSASTAPPGKRSSPPNAIGSTNRLIASMYSGNSQLARAMCDSSTFSTTATWNCRGRQQDREHREHDAATPSSRSSSAGPSNGANRRGELRVRGGAREQVAEAAEDPERDEQPDGEEGDELDHRLERDRGDHPSCRSAASRWRVPKRIVKAASSSAT